MRRPLIPTLLLILAAAADPPARALAACAALSPMEYVTRAEAVAVARVVKEAPRGTAVPQPVILQVERAYKGDLGNRIVVVYNPAEPDALFLEQAQRYLLFMGRWPDGTRRAAPCSGSRPLAGDLPPEFAAVLGQGNPPTGASDPAPQQAYEGAPPASPRSVAIFRTLGFGIPALLVGTALLLMRRRR